MVSLNYLVILGMDINIHNSPVGLTVTAGMECMLGSATYFISTGTSL